MEGFDILINPPLFNSINQFISFQILLEEENLNNVNKSVSQLNLPSPGKSISLAKQTPPSPSPSPSPEKQQEARKSVEGISIVNSII